MTQFDQHMADARASLSQVVQRYPGTDAAKLAAERLTKIPPDAPRALPCRRAGTRSGSHPWSAA